MILSELLGTDEFTRRVKIYGTDVDEEELQKARSASYTEREMNGLPLDLRERYFERVGDRFGFRTDLRRSVIFGRLDILHDAPISRLDLLTCRNTLMYFNADTQAQVIERFSFALNDLGVLVLGKAETLLSRSQLFDAIDRKRRVFRKIAGSRPRERIGEVFSFAGGAEGQGIELHRATLSVLPMPVMLFGPDGMLMDANELARERFGITQRDVGQLVQDLDISYRPVDLRTPVTEALTERRMRVLSGVPFSSDGTTTNYNISALPMLEGPALLGVALVFEDTTQVHDLEDRLERSTLEVEQAYQELQSTNEELETTNEELQSTIEELETTNEELQSTNEELETMNEELQSTNDELHAVNEELRVRGDEVDQLNHFLQAVFTSFGGAVVVVDTSRRIRVWNPQAEEFWGLREDEVRGVDLLALDIGLPVNELARPLQACLARSQDGSVTVAAITRRGRKVECRVTLTPLHAKGTIDGALVVMDVVPA